MYYEKAGNSRNHCCGKETINLNNQVCPHICKIPKRCRTTELLNRQVTQHTSVYFYYLFTTMSTYERENDATRYIALHHNTVLRKFGGKKQSDCELPGYSKFGIA